MFPQPIQSVKEFSQWHGFPKMTDTVVQSVNIIVNFRVVNVNTEKMVDGKILKPNVINRNEIKILLGCQQWHEWLNIECLKKPEDVEGW
jgi:hypothetical protein